MPNWRRVTSSTGQDTKGPHPQPPLPNSAMCCICNLILNPIINARKNTDKGFAKICEEEKACARGEEVEDEKRSMQLGKLLQQKKERERIKTLQQELADLLKDQQDDEPPQLVDDPPEVGNEPPQLQEP